MMKLKEAVSISKMLFARIEKKSYFNFSLTLHAFLQILLTQDSARVHREVLKNMPILRRLARAKLDDQQVKLMGNILDDLAE